MNAHPGLAIEAKGLTKTFGDTHAVNGIDLEVQRGSVHGFLGPNGAGKTTVVRILATLLRPDSGKAAILGYDLLGEADVIRGHISLTGQYASMDEDLTGFENLFLLGLLLGYTRSEAKRRASELLDACGLGEAAGRPVKGYSGGMKRRLDVAASIVVTPDLLFLDEPTTGLDPRSRNEVWRLIRTLAEQGTTVLLTTQYLDEADQLADRVSVIDQGRVIAEGTAGELKSSVGAGSLHVRLRNPAQREDARCLLARELQVPVTPEIDPASLSARVSDARLVERALTALGREEIAVTEFAFGEATLDEVFLALTGHGPRRERNETANTKGDAA
ncbi:MAG: ATP-binding cassette domain-containing protein [Dehalococcoidia bacterium]